MSQTQPNQNQSGKPLTLRELSAYRQTEEFCLQALAAVGMDGSKAPRESKRWSEIIKERTAEEWVSVLKKVRKLNLSPGEAILYCEEHMIKNGFIPPHFDSIIDCHNCGPVAWLEFHKGQEVMACPYCDTTNECRKIIGGLNNG